MSPYIQSTAKSNDKHLFTIKHPIHRFKVSNWFKEGHMTWIIFNNVNVWKLIHVCYLVFYISLTLEEAGTL